MKALSLWYTGPQTAEIREGELTAPEAGQVQVRARYGSLSRGTETLIFNHEVPPHEYERMRAPFQWGTLPEPVSYGYINVGEIEAGDERRLGETVFCLHPHHDRFVIPGTAAITIPSGIPAERCILAANAETALNAVWDGQIQIGHRVQVVGAGVVGCLVAHLASRIPGVDVEVVDSNPARAPIAERLGARFRLADSAGSGFDVIFECSGAPPALAATLPRLRTEGSIVVVSWYGDQPVSLPLGADFHSRRLTLKSSQVGQVANAMRHISHRERLQLALGLLNDPSLDCLVTERIPFRKLPELLPSLLGRNYAGICTRIEY